MPLLARVGYAARPAVPLRAVNFNVLMLYWSRSDLKLVAENDWAKR